MDDNNKKENSALISSTEDKSYSNTNAALKGPLLQINRKHAHPQGKSMHKSKQRSNYYQENQQFLSHTYTSKAAFIKAYKKLFNEEIRAAEIYFLVLNKLINSISENNLNDFKKLSNFIDYIHNLENQKTLREHYNNNANPLKNTNLIILTCQNNNVTILDYLFETNNKILDNLTVNIERKAILPNDEDDSCHNAFYYAIRTGNVDLLDKLINKWPGNYFAVHSRELDKIISLAYDELKLKNVPLLEEIEIFVEDVLINIRFFSDGSKQIQNAKEHFNNIRQRIELVLQNISLLIAEYSSEKNVDEKFLFIAKFIAQNINILKQQLRSTYDKLPWEEIEFCVISFVFCHKKQHENNLFYRFTMNKIKILHHLENFGKKLREETNNIDGDIINKFACLPNKKREEVVSYIIKINSQFEQLYNDYQQIRDIYSLEKISKYIKIGLSADTKQREGQLIITRVLQVIGENLKNSLESPNLSNFKSEFLLLLLPKNTRKVIIDLRNSFSHAYSLSKRTEIEQNTDANFFIGIQNDIKKIDDVITGILYNSKMKIIRILLKKLSVCENLDELKEIGENFGCIKIETMFDDFKLSEHEKLEKLIKELSDNVPDKKFYEHELFNKINIILNNEKTKAQNVKMNYLLGFESFKDLVDNFFINSNITDHNNVIRTIKWSANKALNKIDCDVKTGDLKEIAELSTQICHIARSKMQDDILEKVNNIIFQIFLIVEFGTDDIKWIEKLRKKLKQKSSLNAINKASKGYEITENEYNNQLEEKLSELKNILTYNELSEKLCTKFSSYKNDEKLQAAVEMLVLDIMSILSESRKHLENSLLFLDDNTPLLIGKCLRNHLAHENTLVNALLSDPSKAIILNAKKLISKNITKSKKKLGKLINDVPSELKEKLDQSLRTITNQEKMFTALEKGNIKNFKKYLRKGADIKARSNMLWTTLHFAAKGPSLEAIKYIINQKFDVNLKDLNDQSPLHIAAAHGRKNTVEFFLTETGICVDDLDKKHRTPLHIAAEHNNKEVVEILLKNNASTNTKDKRGLSPLHYAIKHNHIIVAKILLEKETNVDMNEILGGFTPLHLAAERGHLELVNFLLRNGANVNAKTDKEGMPLHLAALNGHLEVVNALILKGANVNSRDISGCIPLHYAIENGNRQIANILLEHGSNVNVVDNTYNDTPLHFAVNFGHEEIVKDLLKNKANTSIATVEGFTALHLASNLGHLKIVAALLKHGVEIHCKNKHYVTALHISAYNGHREIVELLIKNGAKIYDEDNEGLTPLHLAALKGHKDIVELIINTAQIKALDINTVLHVAAEGGNIDIIDLLIKNKADVNIKNNNGVTPLQIAVANGQNVAAAFLIKNKAEVNATYKYDLTPLHTAVIKSNKEVVNLLIKNKAKVNAESDYGTPLQLAVIMAHLEILKFLIAKGADINVIDNKMVKSAVLAGNKDIVDTLLKTKPHINIKDPEYAELLHSAIIKGHTHIVKYLIKKGFDVNSQLTIDNFLNVTPLYIAAGIDQEEIAEILITNGANVNVVTEGGAPLHVATEHGHNNVVQILLSNGASIDIKDSKNRTPLELAVVHGYVQIVKMFLQFNKVNINARTQDGLTLLHIASQKESNLNMVKFLVNVGCDLNAKNNKGSKPIHIAAREGNKDTVEFYLRKGLSINEYGARNQTLLHYAAIEGHLEVIKYLIAQGANVNAKDSNGATPMHIAASVGCKKDAIEILINNYGIYNASDNMLGLRPVDVAYNEDVKYLFTLIEKLFESVKCNDSSEVENNIRAGAYVNAKNADNATSLHYAAWKGYDKVVKILLQNKANPNAVGKNGFTPIHYATKFSHLKIVKMLLYHGAVYNTLSDSGKIPLDFAVDEDIAGLFKLINKSFKQIMENNIRVIEDLNKIKDIDTVKIVMRACNRKNETLIVAAIHNNFSEVGQLKQIWQSDVSIQHNVALALMVQEKYENALFILRKIFERRKEILGSDNPGTLDIQVDKVKVLYKQGHYQDALSMLEEIFQKQKRVLGLNDIDTLKTRDLMALVLHRQGENEKAGNIYQEIYQKQNEILGPAHSDTLNTQLHMALVLDKQGKFEEALNINKTVFERRKETLGTHNLDTVKAKNNIAMVLLNQGKLEESLKIYKEVLEEKKCIIGINHSDTLRTLHSIAGVLFRQQKHNEALKTFQEVLNIQEKVLPKDHPETLITEYSIAEVLFAQRKYITALKVYRHNFDKTKSVFGPYHQMVLVSRVRMESIKMELKLEDIEVSVFQDLQRDINIAASNGDLDTVQHLLKSGGNANDIDLDGRTPLHYAVSNGHINVLNILLKYGADMTQVTNKGNTPLHIATNQGCKEIVQILLERISRDKLNVFVNSKTTSSGTTSLHIAAKNCFLEIVKCLLKHGAAYNIKNKEGKMPINVSKDPEVVHFFEVIEEMFESTKKGNVEVLDKLKLMKQDEFLAVTNALNNHGRTLLQIAIVNKHKNLTEKLLKMLALKNQNCL